MPVITARGLTKDYLRRAPIFPFSRQQSFRALHPLSLSIAQNQMLGLVGESGSGKSTVGALLLGVTAPSAGEIRLGDEPVLARRDSRWRAQRRKMQLVHQDPASALDPRRPIISQVVDPLTIHRADMSNAERHEVASSMLARVGLGSAFHGRRPTELSGGQKQRVVLARALLLKPQFIVYDEAVSALDMTIQRHVLELISELQEELGLSSLFISHDLGCVRSVCDKVAVLYRGHLVELGDVEDIFKKPSHPYTRTLISAIPSLDRAARPTAGQAATAEQPEAITGCPFALRCAAAEPICRREAPSLRLIRSSQQVSCHFPRDGAMR